MWCNVSPKLGYLLNMKYIRYQSHAKNKGRGRVFRHNDPAQPSVLILARTAWVWGVHMLGSAMVCLANEPSGHQDGCQALLPYLIRCRIVPYVRRTFARKGKRESPPSCRPALMNPLDLLQFSDDKVGGATDKQYGPL